MSCCGLKLKFTGVQVVSLTKTLSSNCPVGLDIQLLEDFWLFEKSPFQNDGGHHALGSIQCIKKEILLPPPDLCFSITLPLSTGHTYFNINVLFIRF